MYFRSTKTAYLSLPSSPKKRQLKMPRCFLAKKSSSSTSPLTSSSSSCTNSSSEIEEGNNHLDDHLTPLTEKWDDTITVKSEIEEVEDEEGISSDGNSSSNSGEDHFLPPSRLIHRSTVGSISAAQAVQSIKEPLKVGTPCVETSVKSSTSIYHQNYDSNNENFIPSHIKNDDAQSNVPEILLEKKENSISKLTSSTSTIATQTYSNPEDDSEEEDIKPNIAILNRKPNSVGGIDGNKQKEEILLSSSNPLKQPLSTKYVLSSISKFEDGNLPDSMTLTKSTDLNGNDERTKPSYLEQKEKLENNLLNQTLRFCSRKHSKKHQKRKKKLLNSKLSVGLTLTATDGINSEANRENGSNCLGKSFQHPLKLNKSFATLTVVHPVQQQPSLASKTQQKPPEQSLHVNPFPIKTATKVSSNNFKLLPQQPVAITTSTPVFPISSPPSKPITGISFPATAVTAGGATIHPISAPASIECRDMPRLSSTINNTTSAVQTSSSAHGKLQEYSFIYTCTIDR